MTRVRLNKFLSEQGICSRRSADEQIRLGRIKVNDQVAKVGDFIDPETDIIYLNHSKIDATKQDLIYYAFYKPRGVITTKEDELGRKSVIDYIPKNMHLNPVGRLDKDSEGLLILTNDGVLTQELTHPKFEHEKEYYIEAHMSDKFGMDNLKRLVHGINISGTKMKASQISHVMVEKKHNLVKFNMVLTTGYNRQIRRMCDKIGLSVNTIMRIRIGKLDIAKLKLQPGKLKVICRDQIL